ncbi:MAG TPA: insulinase family protein, partial [Thermoanaerobaculia bacterium]|nr:insulinase family protein [Thermoanaerobaculia bacterium]
MSAPRRLPPPPLPPLPFVLPTFTGTRLANGLAVRAARWGRRPTVAVSVLFPGAGSAADPPGREGMAEIAGDTFLGGTRRRDARALAEEIDDLAAVLEVSAGSDSSVGRLFVLEHDLDEGLALLVEVLTESTFPEDEFEKNRRRQIDVLVEQRSEPDFLARERLLDRLYPGHPYGRLTATEKGLEALTRDDVASFAATRFSFADATLIIVGAADPDALIRAAARAFEGLPAGLRAPFAAVP